MGLQLIPDHRLEQQETGHWSGKYGDIWMATVWLRRLSGGRRYRLLTGQRTVKDRYGLVADYAPTEADRPLRPNFRRSRRHQG